MSARSREGGDGDEVIPRALDEMKAFTFRAVTVGKDVGNLPEPALV